MNDQETAAPAPVNRLTEQKPTNGHSNGVHKPRDFSRYESLVDPLKELAQSAKQISEFTQDQYGCTQDDPRQGHGHERSFLRTRSNALLRHAVQCLEGVTAQERPGFTSRTASGTLDHQLMDLAGQCEQALQPDGLVSLQGIRMVQGDKELLGAANTLQHAIGQFQQAYQRHVKTHPPVELNGTHTGNGVNGKAKGSSPNGRTL